jgi:ABC-2 type transport system ATP-binding protein
VLERFGDPCGGSAKLVSVRLRQSEDALASAVRALDAEGVTVADLRLHQPTLDDVFLAKTGRSLEGAGDDDPAPAGELEPVPAPA